MTVTDALTWEMEAEPPRAGAAVSGRMEEKLQAKWSSQADPASSQCREAPVLARSAPDLCLETDLTGSVHVFPLPTREAGEKSHSLGQG